VSASANRRALKLLRAAVAPDPDGYVHLQDTAYRGHHLLASAVLDATKPGAVIFEGGVSSGYFARVLTDAGLIVDGFELDPVAAARARSVCRNVWVGDLQAIDANELSGPYDVLLFGDTLEHIADPVAVLRRLSPLLRPGGVLIVSIPNFANWAVRLQVLLGRFRYSDRGILDRTHLRFYTEHSLVEMLRDAGYEPSEVRGAVPVPFVRNVTVARVIHKIGNLRRSLFAYSFIVTARPADNSTEHVR
jgi:2-polyprenyl-3-methyl-5-hydroxy-6-metoxy-1,4-benzoquinol methylase